jgi:putative membrane protein
MKRKLMTPLLCILALAVSACHKEADTSTATDTSTSVTDTSGMSSTTDTTSTTSTTSTTGTVSAVDPGDQEFMTKAAQGGMAEVTLGQMASSKAISPEAKNFGNRMVTDHSKANDELTQLAQTKGVTLPTDTDQKSKEVADKLSKANGKDFDKQYISDMVDDHETDVKEFEKASTSSKDPDLKAWAAKTLPTLKDHLKMAKEAKSKLK